MIKLKLDDREAWVLYHLLDTILDADSHTFYTTEENEDGDDVESFDQDLFDETVSLRDKLGKLRGIV